MEALTVKKWLAPMVVAILTLVCVQAHATLGMLGGAAASSSGGFTATFFVSPTGSNSNDCSTYATPCDISVFMPTPNGSHVASYYQAAMAGKTICLLPGYYAVDSYYESQIPASYGYAQDGVLLTIPGGTASTPTHVASCNSTGGYQARTATIDAHPGATTGQGSVTYGVAGWVTSVSTSGNAGCAAGSTCITLGNGTATNPFASLVGKSVFFCDSPSASDWTAIGITPCNSTSNATLYPITAVGGTSGAWTVTVTASTTGTFTPNSQASIYWNYPRGEGTIIGQSHSVAWGGITDGNWTLDGVNVTGSFSIAIEGKPATSGGRSYQVTGITAGANTVLTVTLPTGSGSAIYPAAGQLIYCEGIQGSGTLTSLNYSTSSQNYYTISSVSGTFPWTVTLNGVSTSGVYTGSSVAWCSDAGSPGITIENLEVYDGQGKESSNPGLIYIEKTNGTLLTNDKVHDMMVGASSGGLGSGQGIFLYTDYGCTVQYTSEYNVSSGIDFKSNPEGSCTVQYDYIETMYPWPPGGSQSNFQGWPVENGGTPIVPGMAKIVRNDILVGLQGMEYAGVDSPPANAGQIEFYNNTVYWKYNLTTSGVNVAGVWNAGGYSPSGEISVSPAPDLTSYNNLMNGSAGGQTVGWYIAGRGTGTSASPANLNISLDDYNLLDTNSSFAFGLDLSYTDNNYFPSASYTLAAWQTATSFDMHSAIGTPTYSSSNLGYQYPTSNFQLTSGSAGHLMGRIGGTSGGAATDVGAWGGVDVNTSAPPAQIGSSF